MTLTEIETATAAWINAVRGARVLVKGRIGEAAAPEAPYVMFAANLVEMPDFVAVGFHPLPLTPHATVFVMSSEYNRAMTLVAPPSLDGKWFGSSVSHHVTRRYPSSLIAKYGS